MSVCQRHAAKTAPAVPRAQEAAKQRCVPCSGPTREITFQLYRSQGGCRRHLERPMTGARLAPGAWNLNFLSPLNLAPRCDHITVACQTACKRPEAPHAKTDCRLRQRFRRCAARRVQHLAEGSAARQLVSGGPCGCRGYLPPWGGGASGGALPPRPCSRGSQGVCRSSSQYAWQKRSGMQPQGAVRHLGATFSWRQTARRQALARAACSCCSVGLRTCLAARMQAQDQV